jgi:hypothetical protein
MRCDHGGVFRASDGDSLQCIVALVEQGCGGATALLKLAGFTAGPRRSAMGPHLVARLRHGSGLRLMECPRFIFLRVPP